VKAHSLEGGGCHRAARQPARQRSAPAAINGIEFRNPRCRARPSSSSNRIACWSSGKGKALLSKNRRSTSSYRAHPRSEQAQSVVQHPKVDRAVVDDGVGLGALPLSLRRRRVVQRPKVGRAVVDVVVGFVVLLLSPRER
jgi:hypothetical protein